MFPVSQDVNRFQVSPSGPASGRVVLLVAAYAPVMVLVGLRGLPSCAGWLLVGAGVIGVLTWAAFLLWLRSRTERTLTLEDPEFIDAEVTGYIVSILLPLVAADDNPSTGDWLAYGLCAVLVLVVAFQAGLWAVNPITYAFRMRAARAVIDGRPRIVLVSGTLGTNPEKIVTNRLGVTLILRDAL
jgi:hypothetical protein